MEYERGDYYARIPGYEGPTHIVRFSPGPGREWSVRAILPGGRMMKVDMLVVGARVEP